MSYAPVFTAQYIRRAGRFLKWHPELKLQYLKTLQLLEANPFHPGLRLHSLSGRFEGLHAVSINLAFRVTLELLMPEEKIIPVNISDRDAVY